MYKKPMAGEDDIDEVDDLTTMSMLA